MESRCEDREVMANRPDIVIKNRKEKTSVVMDVAIPADRKFMQKETTKQMFMYREIQRMWNMKCVIIPVVTGDTGIVTKVLKDNFEATPGKHSIDSLQETAVLVT